MVDVVRKFRVDVPIDQVARFLRDFENAPLWDPGTRKCTQISDGPIVCGTQWRNESKLFGISTELRYTLVTDSSTRIVFSGENKTAKSIDDITLVSVNDFSTGIEYHATVEFNGVAKQGLGKVVFQPVRSS